MKYPAFNSDDWKALEEAYSQELMKRRDAIDQAWQWYDGKFKDCLAPDGTQTDDNVKIPIVEMIINAGVSSMQGVDDAGIIEGIKFEVSQPEEKETETESESADPDEAEAMRFTDIQAAAQPENKAVSPEQAFLDRLFEVNKKNLFTHKLFLNGGVTGHVFIRLVPNAIKDIKTGKMLPRLIVLNTGNVSAFWRVDDLELVVFYRIEHGEPGKRVRQDIYQSIDDSSGMAVGLNDWQIVRYIENGKTGEWTQEEPIEWTYPFAPIVDWQNLPNTRDYYGKDDIGLTGKLNESHNFTASNYQRILKYQAHRTDLLIGAEVSDVQSAGVGMLLTVQNENAKVVTLQGAPAMDSSLDFLALTRRSSFDTGRELDPSTVADKLGDLTNFALRVLNDARLSKRHTKWLNAEEGFETLCQHCLLMDGFAAETEINVIPPDPLPQDPLQQAQTLTIDTQHGVSNRTYMEKRGYDPDQEKQRRTEQREENVADQSMIATSQAFGGAAEMGRRMRREQGDGQAEQGRLPAGDIAGRPAAAVG